MTRGPKSTGARRARWATRRPDIGWAFAALVISLAAVISSTQLWRWTPGTPFGLNGDSAYIAATLKELRDQGWIWNNPALGYPYGQVGAFFPELDWFEVALVKLLNVFFDNPWTPGVVFFILGFPAATLAAYLLARSQRVGPAGAAVVGVLFAHAPGHAQRFGHLWLAAYWVLPICLWLVLEVASGSLLLGERTAGRHLWRRPRAWLIVAAVAVVGLSGAYHVGFTLILLLVVTLARRAFGGPRGYLPGLGVMAGIALTAAIPLAVARAGTSRHTVTGRVPAERAFAESEVFAGKPLDLVLPWTGHRLDALAHLTWAYRAVTKATVEEAALGLVGTLGFALLLALALVTLLGRPLLSRNLGRWSALSLVCLALYTVGGLGAFIALFFTPQLRTWSRVSLIILLLSLMAVGSLITRVESHRRVVAGVMALGLIGIGLLDQTNPDTAPDHDALAIRMMGLTAYSHDLERATEPGCGVFQIPVVPFPESIGPQDMDGYAMLLPYLGGGDLRWSGAGMRGTAEADWQQAIDPSDLTALAADLRSVGFCAIEVDTFGFSPRQNPTSALDSVLGAPIAASDNGEFVAYDVRQAGAAGEDDDVRRASVLEPVIVALDGYPPVVTDADLTQPIGPVARLRIANLGEVARPVNINLTIQGQGTSTRTVTISDSGRDVATIDIDGQEPRVIEVAATAQPGITELTVTIDGDPIKDPAGHLVSGTLLDLTTTASEGRAVSLLNQVRTGWITP